MTEQIYRLAESLVWRRVEGQVVVLDASSSSYFAVNESAAVLWNRLATGATREELLRTLQSEFQAPDGAEADLDAFLVDARQRGFVVEL